MKFYNIYCLCQWVSSAVGHWLQGIQYIKAAKNLYLDTEKLPQYSSIKISPLLYLGVQQIML